MAVGKILDTDTVDALWFKYFLSCCAASCAETVTYPLDLIKTRLQIQGELASAENKPTSVYRGFIGQLSSVVRREGLFQLWRGLCPAIARHSIYTGVRMNGYEALRNHVRTDSQILPVWQAALCGLCAGGLGQFLASPADLVKVQLQTEGHRRLQGLPARVEGMLSCVVYMVNRGGVRCLWRGCVPNVQRSALVNLGDLSTYDSVKTRLVTSTDLSRDHHLTHFLSSLCSGLVSALLGTPADVVKTRVMNQPLDQQGRGVTYRSSVHCLLSLVRGEGLMALYKGFVPCWLRMAPWSMTFWFSYENLRRFSGTGCF